MIRHKLCGVGAAMITPFTPEGKVDYQALACMIDYVIEGGVDYIVALGTTAETPTLYMPERAVIAMFITNHIAGRVPLVMGCAAIRRRRYWISCANSTCGAPTPS